MHRDEKMHALDVLRLEGGADASRWLLEPVIGGMSGAAIFRAVRGDHPPRYLKVAIDDVVAGLRDEIARTGWLATHGISVPRILRINDRGVSLAVLSEAMPGVPADTSPLPVPRLIEGLAKGLAALHALPAAGCPFDESLATRLSRAAEAVSAGEIDPDEFDPRNRNVAPEALLKRLTASRPDEDTVVVHGDATLSNIIIDESGTPGFLDCGHAGRGDRYLDLAVLSADIEEHFGARAAARFAEVYGVSRWDKVKAGYYLDLYELF